MDHNTGFAQYGLRNAGELVRIDPSLGMAEFISNSAILPPICRSATLAVERWTRPRCEKWQSLVSSLPSRRDQGGVSLVHHYGSRSLTFQF